MSHVSDDGQYEEVICNNDDQYVTAERQGTGRIARNEEYVDMNQTRTDPDYEEAVIKTLNDAMLTKEYFLEDTPKFISQFNSTKGRMGAKAESFVLCKLLDSSPDIPIFGGHLNLLALLANCNSSHVVRKTLDNLLNEIFLSIGDTTRCHNLLAAEQVLRESVETVLVEEHQKAKTQRITTYGWLITLVLLQWNELNCPKNQLHQIGKFDRTLDRLMSHRDNRERNLFRYGIVMARECIRRITAKKRDLRDIAQRHLKTCKNILHSAMEIREIESLQISIDDNSWLDLHICLVHLQELPKLHQFKDDPKPVALIQKLITSYRMRYTARLRQRLTVSKCGWKFELLVYRVLLKLIRVPTCRAIIQQVLCGTPGCDGIRAYWKPEYGLIRSTFASEYLRKLCRKAIFVNDPEARKEFANLVIDDNKVLMADELSVGHLSSVYRNRALHVSSSNSLAHIRHKDDRIVRDGVMDGEKCTLKMFQHSGFDDDIMSLRSEIEILKSLNDAKVPCPNIVRLLASGTDLPAHMITERTTKGDLLTYLQNKKKDPPQNRELRKIALDVCNAIEFLGQYGIVHRDLRAANVFVFDTEEGEVVCKLGDFCLSRIVSSDQGETLIVSPNDSEYLPLAVRWMAVESLRLGEFSPASDVWSFGVLLFEIFTLGCQPYKNMPNGLSLYEDEEVKEFILDGHRMELYASIPVQVKLIIGSMWIENRNERPTFGDLKRRLEDWSFSKRKVLILIRMGLCADITVICTCLLETIIQKRCVQLKTVLVTVSMRPTNQLFSVLTKYTTQKKLSLLDVPLMYND